MRRETPESGSKIDHQGVCGLETMSQAHQIISVSCNGKIAICDEDSMGDCKVVSTGTNWHCASLICEPATLCLGDMGGNIGYMGLTDKQPKNIFKAHEQLVNALSLVQSKEPYFLLK